MRSTSPERLQQCQSVRRLEQFAKINHPYWASGEAHRDLMAGLHATAVQSGEPRANPIPLPAPEMRDFYYRDPRQKEADFWQDLKLGLLLTLALLGAVAVAAYLLLR